MVKLITLHKPRRFYTAGFDQGGLFGSSVTRRSLTVHVLYNNYVL